jgi:C-terminal processing protease CtpA/Prc
MKKVFYAFIKEWSMKASILDLHNNPCGLLDSAINIMSSFIEDTKLIFTTK